MRATFPTPPRRAICGLAAAVLALAAPCAPASAADKTPARFGVDEGAAFTIHVMSWKDIPFRTVVRQQYDFSCGSAAVATLLRYQYGVPVKESDAFQAMWRTGDQPSIRKVGFSMLDMKGYLDSLGYVADGYKLPLDTFAKFKLPAIVLIQIGKYKHFVVLKGIRADKVLLGDPALGLLVVQRWKFEKIWNGIIFAIHKTPSNTPAPKFNLDDEWRPWASAPTQSALPRWSVADLNTALPNYFQIQPPATLINLANPLASVP